MKIIIIILQAILNLVRKRRDLIANRSNINIPPEYRDDVVVYYSPTKQKLTNYDVIESYTDDFTKWRIENTGVTSTQKKIVIAAGTELKYNVAYKGFGNSIAKFDIKYTGNAVIRYQYNKEDGTTGIITINRSGIYHLPASIKAQKNFGFYCNPQTVTEEATIEQLPTSILKDFSGNGLDAYMYGFQGKLNSGVGIYQTDFTTWGTVPTSGTMERSPNSLHITNVNKTGNAFIHTTEKVNAFKVKIEGDFNGLTFRYIYDSVNDGVLFINSPGIYDFPAIENTNYNNGFYGSVFGGDCDITVTQIPDYPNSLCYAGKQYCKAYGLPILDDYTIIARRTWFDKDGTFANKGSNNPDIKSLFIFENKANNKTVTRTSSFGSWNNVDIPDEGINWQTKNKYNNANIVSGIEQDGSDIFTIGGYNSTNAGNWYGYHDDIILLNRSLTVDEINDITKAVFKEDILKPTFDLKATDVIDVVNDRGRELTEYTDIYGVNYTFNNFTLGDAVGNKDYPNALYFTPNKQNIRFAPNKAIKTVIIDGIFYETCVVYDSRGGDYATNFALYTGNNGENYIAWNARANNAKTYINGELNTTIKGTELYGIRHITAMTKNASSAKVNTINGIDPTFNNKLIIYRITGFDYELTPNQIKNWYEQNKPE